MILGEPSKDEDLRDNRVAIEFFEQVGRVGSERAGTYGSGSGIRTREGGLLGDGVSLDDVLVDYGVQRGQRVVPQPQPSIIYPVPQQPNDMNQSVPRQR